jgi:predicted CXXCH cytochrome family protein
MPSAACPGAALNDTRAARWFHLLPNEKAPAGDVLHWTGRYQTANTMCIGCHTTGFDKRYDALADRFDSRWSEINVSCQSCHGPGSRHVEWAQTHPAATSAPKGLLAALSTPQAQLEVCAACHSRRSELTTAPVPGQPHLDHYLPSLLREGLYHADGQQLDEVFVAGSYRQSKMYRMGVACTNCHDPHRAQPKLQGNALCTQCHQPQPNPAFPSAAGHFDTPQHHHHPQGSPGAKCTACHMPAKNYMVVQPRPDHSIRIPRPDLSLTLGTPNACNQCHDKKSAQWAADALTQWYGTPQRPPHYGEVFAAARRGAAESAQALAALAGDAAQPGIVRATAIDLLRGDAAAGIDPRIAATHDADAELRAAAAASLEVLPASLRVPTLAPLLRDPLRAVRIAAARSLASLPHAQFDPATRPAFDAALAEYVAAQKVALDMPGPNLNLGALYSITGRDAEAEAAYRAALKIDPDFTPARANLAQFYAERGRLPDAEQVLRDGLQRQPGIGELQYSLGLLLAEQQRLAEAADALDRAAKLLPQRARAHYNLGLARQQLGQPKPAEAALRKARELAPTDPAIAYALAVFYAAGPRRRLARGRGAAAVAAGQPASRATAAATARRILTRARIGWVQRSTPPGRSLQPQPLDTGRAARPGIAPATHRGCGHEQLAACSAAAVGAWGAQFSSTSFQNFEPAMATPASRPFLVSVKVSALAIASPPRPPPACLLSTPACAVAPPLAVQPLSTKLFIAAAVLNTISTSFSAAPICAPTLAEPIAMKVSFFVLLLCTSPLPPAPPTRKLLP